MKNVLEDTRSKMLNFSAADATQRFPHMYMKQIREK